MATAREVGYFPEEAEARPGDRLLQASDRRLSIEYRPGQRDKPRVRPKSRSGSTDSIISYVENPKRNRKFISLWVFSLIVIGIAAMFLLGVCVGFYVRELQTDKPDFKKICGVDDADMMEVKQRDRLGGYHESLAYYIRAKGISDFVE
ncbi:hypothetical protein RRG08_067381 [Elysia crispata]|uniref:Uncharacterized protein n=1 Tax=Elysia crispata TaxID=231223 RepID=A0AAE0Y906_9GAST|nr:hypothetical protein RRG08_067381 [Elysia crispata]